MNRFRTGDKIGSYSTHMINMGSDIEPRHLEGVDDLGVQLVISRMRHGLIVARVLMANGDIDLASGQNLIFRKIHGRWVSTKGSYAIDNQGVMIDDSY